MSFYLDSEDYEKNLFSPEQFGKIDRQISEDKPENSEESSILSLFNLISSYQFKQNSQTDIVPQKVVPQIDLGERREIDNVYEKNICSYISKIVYQKFVENKYKRKVMKMCNSLSISYQSVLSYYRSLKVKGFGISLLIKLITPENEEQVAIKKVFSTFLNWYLREKYLLYMMEYGKMSEKEKYIEFKNKYLLYMAEVQDKFSAHF